MLPSANFSEVEAIAQKATDLPRIPRFNFGIWVKALRRAGCKRTFEERPLGEQESAKLARSGR
jgi:hypothetical protein